MTATGTEKEKRKRREGVSEKAVTFEEKPRGLFFIVMKKILNFILGIIGFAAFLALAGDEPMDAPLSLGEFALIKVAGMIVLACLGLYLRVVDRREKEDTPQ